MMGVAIGGGQAALPRRLPLWPFSQEQDSAEATGTRARRCRAARQLPPTLPQAAGAWARRPPVRDMARDGWPFVR